MGFMNFKSDNNDFNRKLMNQFNELLVLNVLLI